ncbi:MAG TPA: retropepsin-like aspartic protease [Flavisolibacter sp.]|nr:retropepsin-like aspartic protease [Flavisolibacter sp.]
MTRTGSHIITVLLAFVFNALGLAGGAKELPPDERRFVLMDRFSIKTQPGAINDSTSCIIPFTRAGNLILIQATADTMQGNFILDTGAPNLVLNITYFRDYPASQDGEVQTGITGSGSAVQKTSLGRFSFGSLDYSRIPADLVNLGHIENSRGVKILGLIGTELFRQCEMIIDYEKGLIYLHRIGKKESKTYQHEMLGDTSAYRILPIELKDNRIMVTTEMAGKKLKFVIDYAAESNVLDSRLPDKIFDNVTITRRVVLSGAGDRKVDALYGDLQNMKLGNQDLGTLPILITNLENTCFSYAGCVDGVLGFDFLSLHKIGFNFVNRKMYIWK